VVIDPETLEMDEAATQEWREKQDITS